MPRQSAFKPRRHYFYDPKDGDHIMEDGDFMHVPVYLQDAAQREVRDHFVHDHFVRDALARHNANGLHRPGFCIDALVHAPEPTTSVSDADADLLERRGTTVRAVFADRERAFAETERRQQWRTVLDARTRLKVEPESDDDDNDNADDDESDGELVGSAEYGSEGDHEYQPDDQDDNGDDDDVFSAPRAYKQKGQYGSQEYGHSGGAPDASGIRAPEDDRERARLERDQRGNNAWRNGSSVSRATTIQQQLERWRGNK